MLVKGANSVKAKFIDTPIVAKRRKPFGYQRP
jgi:hypothetical protein